MPIAARRLARPRRPAGPCPDGSAPRSRARASPAKLRRKPAQSLVDSMPTISTSGRGTRSSRSASAAAMTRPPSALWPPSSHSSLPAGASGGSVPLRQPLQARRPLRLDDALLEGARRQLRARRRAAPRSPCRHCRTDGGRTAAAPADRAGRRRPDRRAGRAPRRRSSPGRRRAAARRPARRGRSITASGPSVCRPITAGTPRLRMPPSRRRSSRACRRGIPRGPSTPA